MQGAMIEHLQKVVRTLPEIVAVYVFGSFAKGEVGKESDLDIAFIVENKKRTDEHKLYEAIRTVSLPADLDMVVADSASSPLLLFEIVSTGKRIFARSEDEAIAFEAYVLKTYYDTSHMRKIYYEYLKEKFPPKQYGNP